MVAYNYYRNANQHFTPVRMVYTLRSPQVTHAREGVEKRKQSHTVDGNVNWSKPLWRTAWRFLKKLKIELPYDPAIPHLDTCPDKAIIQRDTRTLCS